MGRTTAGCKAAFEPPFHPIKPDGTACRCSTTRMGHVLAAAPGVERFHLVDRWLRELTARGHRTEVLCVDEADFLFYRLLTGVTEAITACFYLRRDLL